MRAAASMFLAFGLVACNKEAPPAPAPAPAAPAPVAAPAPAPAAAASAAHAGTCSPEDEANCDYHKAVTAAEEAKPAAPAPTSSAPPAAVVAGAQHFGSAFALSDTVPLSTVVVKPDEYAGKAVRVSATISKVCKKRGCWFVLQGAPTDTQTVRVTMKDYAFFVPTDSDGKAAVVEGTLRSVPLPESARKHLAEDGGEDPAKIVGDSVELTLVATAVDIGK